MYNYELITLLEKVLQKSYQMKNGEQAFHCPFGTSFRFWCASLGPGKPDARGSILDRGRCPAETIQLHASSFASDQCQGSFA